ncbi:hypothetical protein DYBT9623_04185 [Dyadobacter sp. CECT 9623]|uniref:ABC transport system permease protein n=1 Tax=Dyadobacter linearis TaxID=2823330 RepID=A0ABN7RFS7_9BACT|nr:ABC transporter permease [Dyadobacter sp. CECT 9623]CAG5072535.1 hypothetical protein DYBT9623_04185 [Dyadobacter sp. CECT 9623]
MISNYFKIAWRNLLKSKFYTLINGAGLTLGLGVGILILLWVQDELSFDRFHKNSESIYKLENLVGTGSSKQIWTSTVAPIAVLGTRELPEIKAAVRMSYNQSYILFRYKDKVFNEEKSMFTDPGLFSVFDFNLIKGDPAKPFIDDNSIVLTETTARKYFGDEDPIGKVMGANDRRNFTVTGIVRDLPKNSTVQGEMFLPIGKLFKDMYSNRPDGRNRDNDFHQFNYDTYFLLQPNVQIAKLAVKLRNIHLRNKPDDTDLTYLLVPLVKRHLYQSDGSNGGIETVRMFVVIALLILGIACINYVNLSTARAMLRAKEVSMRKIVGAARRQLFTQFIVETALIFGIASAFAVLFIYSLLPLYNQLSGKDLTFDLTNIQIWKVIALTLLGTLAVSSIYPAVLLSSFDPLRAFKGKASAQISDVALRKVLVITQFAVSVILIIGTFVISSQLQYIRSKALGYDKAHVLSFNMREMGKHFEAVKADLLSQPGITSVTRASSFIISIGSQTGNNDWDGKEKGETMMIRPMAIEKDFLSFFKMQLAYGAGFKGSVSDSTHFILNETAVKAARLTDPIGKRFKLWDREGTIIGVVKDFHASSMRQTIDPAVFYYEPRDSYQIYIKTTGQNAENAIAAAGRSWKKYNGDFEFHYAFLDQAFNDLYRSEQQSGTLFNLFAGIAILISCLGLFGLAAYTAQVRKREIGVRKVLGSSVAGIVGLLAKDFIQLILVAIVIAVPVAWYSMNSWLQDFAYKISLSWWMFAAAGGMALAVAMLTISYQSIRAALMNPVKSLRSE